MTAAARPLRIAVPAPATAEPFTGRLRIERVRGRSAVVSAFAASPLRILTPRNHGGAAWAYTSSLGGGFVDGDRVAIDVRVGRGAAAFLGTQGATRVYRSPRGCSSELMAEVEEDGLLALVPDPTTCFAGAQHVQRTQVRVAAGASLVLADVLAAGRSARGERWAFRRYESRLAVQVGDRVVLDEAVLLDPAHGPIEERFGRFDALATIVIAGGPLRAWRAAIAEDLAAAPAVPRAPLVESACPLGEDVLLLRIAAVSVEDGLRAVRSRIDFLPALLGDDPWARRN